LARHGRATKGTWPKFTPVFIARVSGIWMSATRKIGNDKKTAGLPGHFSGKPDFTARHHNGASVLPDGTAMVLFFWHEEDFSLWHNAHP
jgi:hypothetical protein